MPNVCDECGREFSTLRGLETHVGKMYEPVAEETLVERYIRENLAAPEIAVRRDLTETAVRAASRNTISGERPGGISHHPTDGYPEFTHTGVAGRGSRVREHRLLSRTGRIRTTSSPASSTSTTRTESSSITGQRTSEWSPTTNTRRCITIPEDPL